MQPTIPERSLIHYDAMRRRLWIAGQRCHHGATGALLTTIAAGALALRRNTAMLALVATGSALMAHDWHDRSMWFQRGWGTQP
jgi:hypothetical protein